MNGAVYAADLLGGQKTGLFYDQRPNHAFAARLARGEVLDVFAHVGGFALAMLAGGAERALCVDASAPALALAERGAEASGLAERLEVRRADAFEAMAALAAEGRRFEVVVCDPPAFAPAKPAREAGLRAYERLARLAAPLVEPGGYVVLCSCSHAVDLAAFGDACARGLGRGGRAAQLVRTGFAGPDHPVHPQLAETGYLKALFYRLPVSDRVLLDACVLYPTVMREIVLGAAAAGAFEPLWSARILEEWRRAAERLGAGQGMVAAGEIALLRARWPGAEVGPGEERAVRLPDPDDHHVLAAAIAAGADGLMTLNAKDFPRRTLAAHGIERLDPDATLARMAGRDLATVVEATRAEAERLSGAPWERQRLLKKAGLPRLAKALDRAGL